ncbi:hypothetical protein ACFYUD_14325 [Nocardia tengchongensis]|uniref:hypothetical protein n=1 Tax=Nocardia tengchongensis TaxID=2055889 RepID=UPI0036B4D508
MLDKLADRIAATRVVIGEIGAAQLRSALEIRSAYYDLNLDIGDATCVVLADHFDTDRILTLDRRDFRVLRPMSRYPAFQLQPDDL